MVQGKPRYAPYKTKVQSQLRTIGKNQTAFDKWHQEMARDSRHSTQDDLPSSQLPTRESVIHPNQRQLFALIDTCSLVKYQRQFTEFLTDLRVSFRGLKCPIKFIIPLVVLHELDKHNRRKKPKAQKETPFESTTRYDNGQDPPIDDILNKKDIPRSFMRIIEEEMRRSEIIVPDLDPDRKLPGHVGLTSNPEINDNQILDSCLRSQQFIAAHPHHPETRVVLVTEDNNFKTKSTTYRVSSFRWLEFFVKFRNFGKKNCVSTPIVPSRETSTNDYASSTLTNGHTTPEPLSTSTPKLNLFGKTLEKLSIVQPSTNQKFDYFSQQTMSSIAGLHGQTTWGKLLPTKEAKFQVNSHAPRLAEHFESPKKEKIIRMDANLQNLVWKNPILPSAKDILFKIDDDEVTVLKEVIMID